MAEVLIRHYIIGLLLFALVITGGVTMLMHGVSEADNIDTTELDAFNNSFNRYTDLQDSTDALQDSLEGAAVNEGLFGALNSLIATSWSTLTSIFTNFVFVIEIFENLISYFGVPAWAVYTALAIFTVIIVFNIFTVVFQREI